MIIRLVISMVTLLSFSIIFGCTYINVRPNLGTSSNETNIEQDVQPSDEIPIQKEVDITEPKVEAIDKSDWSAIKPFSVNEPIKRWGNKSLQELANEKAFNLMTGYSTVRGKELGLPKQVFLISTTVTNTPHTDEEWIRYINSLTPEARYDLVPEFLKDSISVDGKLTDTKYINELIVVIEKQSSSNYVETVCSEAMFVANVRCYETVNAEKLKQLYPWLSQEIVKKFKLKYE